MSEQVVTAPQRPVFLGIAIASFCLALLSLCAPWIWLGALLAHVSAHVIIVLLILVALVRRRKLAALLLLLAITIFSWPWMRQAYEQRSPVLRGEARQQAPVFMAANMAYWNSEKPEDIAEVFLTANPDFCVLIEAHPFVAEILQKSKQWQRRIGNTKVGPYSMLILSRLEVLEKKMHIVQGVERNLGQAFADVKEQANSDILIHDMQVRQSNGQRLRVFAVHTPPPVRPRLFKDQRAVFATLLELIQESTDPFVVLGDLNISPSGIEWRYLYEAGLRRASGALQRTWSPRTLPWMRQFGLQLDYICASSDVALSQMQYVHIPGSDHSAVQCHVLAAKPEANVIEETQ